MVSSDHAVIWCPIIRHSVFNKSESQSWAVSQKWTSYVQVRIWFFPMECVVIVLPRLVRTPYSISVCLRHFEYHWIWWVIGPSERERIDYNAALTCCTIFCFPLWFCSKLSTVWITHKVSQNIIFPYSICCFNVKRGPPRIMPVFSGRCIRSFSLFFTVKIFWHVQINKLPQELCQEDVPEFCGVYLPPSGLPVFH